MATTIKHPYTAPIDFRKTAEDDIVTAFYKNNEVKLIYSGNKKIFESKRLHSTFTAENGSLYIDNLSSLGNITEIYIDGVLQEETTMSLNLTKPTGIKIKGQFTVQGSTCDMYNFFIADGLESVVNVGNTMFRDCTGIENLDLTYFNTSTIKTNMQNLFVGCTNLKTVNINNFDMIQIKTVASMFNGCTSLEKIDMSGWKNTNNITTAAFMFKNCINLKEVYLPQLPSSTNVQGMLSGVPNNCVVYVKQNFPFSEPDLGWDGTFTTV